ncbi:UDP-N-acetylglucosamine 3-dehydrogenase [Dissulfurispira thermophila]|uniref:UDP-N-acetylglucosamine 3-dehydrogenase n=2 Tax=root TaxID=1 RepID=A0A7G1GYC9_9BACT|nr:Gfo/Idh/MocA family oxidoreductase [Dissulfurispira thermophila]BCB95364.1 UDP-N-acetylglucosamine 3-dehydrogenase [Dissulfurispira thermophila]
MLNIGVIGTGYLGQHHARIYSELGSELGNVRLVGVVDADINRAKEVSNKYGCDAFSDYKAIINKVDALSIVTPTTMHYQMALDCIKAGKDILIEKPITVTVEEANELIDASDKAGTIIQVGHLERFNPVFTTMCALISKPVFIETERLSPFLGRGIDVDITLDLMIHDIDIVLALMRQSSDSDNGGRSRESGEIMRIKDIKAAGTKMLTNNIDIAMAWFEFDNGVQVLMKASRVSPEKLRRMSIFQDNSYLLVDYQDMYIKKFFQQDKENLIGEEIISIERKEPLKEELRDFIKCVISRRRPLVSAVEGRDALKIALQINSAIEQVSK